MTDFKSAEQQVRETLGWFIEDGVLRKVGYPAYGDFPSERQIAAYNALVSKTAELLDMTAGMCCRSPHCDGACTCEVCAPDLHIRDLKSRAESTEQQLAEMTAQRDEAQKALQMEKKRADNWEYTDQQRAAQWIKEFEDVRKSYEATIREQAERIRALEAKLDEYGRHLPDCYKLNNGANPTKQPCSCGFEASNER